MLTKDKLDSVVKHFKKRHVRELQLLEDVPKFAPPTPLLAKVTSVYDGDTCTIITRLSKKLPWQTFKVRLLRIDSEEVRQPKNKKNRAELKARALQEKAALSNQILNKLIIVDSLGFDSFGRILAEIWSVDFIKKKPYVNININSWMMKNGTKQYL
jgi:endonuclease YncB( thermonuclease family)